MEYIGVIFNFFIFLLGLCIGSFLNCLIYRIEENKNFFNDRSFCPNCKHSLNWKDLFPIFSFLFLGGKCRYCRKNISWQYPIVELITGVIFLLISLQVTSYLPKNILFLFFWLYIASSLIIIFIYDLKHYLIPDNILLPAIIISFLLYWQNWLAALIAAGFFFIIWAISSGRWMGFGDVKLAILMGFLLGLPNVIVALFIAFFSGSIVGVLLMAYKKGNLKSEIPFGPFLIFGIFVAFFWGKYISSWYLNLYLF